MVKSTPRTPVRGPQWCSATRSPYAGKVGFGLPEVNKNLMKTSKNVKSKVSSGMSRAMVLKQKTTVKPTTRKIVLQRQTTVKMITTPRPARIPIIKQKKPSTSSMQLQLVLTAEQQQQLNDDAGEENVGRLSTTKTPTKIVCVTPISKQNRSEGENASAGGPQMQLLLTPLQKQFYDGSVPRDDDPMDDEGESTIATPSTCPEVREVENRLSCLADRARSNGANCTPHSRKSIGLDEMEKRMSSIKNMKSSDKDCLVCAPPLVSPFTYQPSEMDSQPENSLMRFSIRSTKARMSSSPQQSSPTGSDVIMRDADDNISLPETVHEIEVSQSPYVTRMSLRGIQPSPDEESNIVVSSTPNLVSRLSVNPTSDRKSVVFRSPADESSVSIATPMMRLSYEEGSLVGNVSKPPLREMTYRELQLCAKGLGIAASGKMRTLLTRINRYQNSVQ